jgi:hypothetical protein
MEGRSDGAMTPECIDQGTCDLLSQIDVNPNQLNLNLIVLLIPLQITVNGVEVWRWDGIAWECHDPTGNLCNLVLEIFGENDPTTLTSGMKTINLHQYLNSGLQYYNELASTLMYIDTATVVGGISTFNKAFSYHSGIDCTNC